VRGDPYVSLTDLAARLAPDGDYDYDVLPYYVERHYDYPRFVCYDCHAYATYREWNPYGRPCSRYRVEVRDDPRYYPYRYNRGRNVVADRPRHPGPRYTFRETTPRETGAARDQVRRNARETDPLPAPGLPSLRRRDREPEVELSPARPLIDERRRAERRREQERVRQNEPDDDGGVPEGLQPSDSAPRRARPAQPATPPRSTGEPELRRRRP
jgi:hypothetical protein